MSDVLEQQLEQVEQPQQPEQPRGPEVISEDDIDVTLLPEDPQPPPADDPKRPQYEHVDGKITNKDIQKRIATLNHRVKMEAERAKHFEELAKSKHTALTVMGQQFEAMRTSAKKTTEGALEIARDRNATAKEQARQKYQEAMANGNTEEAAKWSEKMAEAAVDTQILAQTEALGVNVPDIDPRIKEVVEKPIEAPQQKQSEAAVAWARANPDFFKPENAQALAVAMDLERKLHDEGYDIHDGETYVELNRRLTKIIQDAQAAEQQRQGGQQSAPMQRQPVTAAKPPVNGVNRASVAQRTSVSLTPQERADADMVLGDVIPDPKKRYLAWAKQKQADSLKN